MHKYYFDMLFKERTLAPQDNKLNEKRWLIGQSLRQLNERAEQIVNPNATTVLPLLEVWREARIKLEFCKAKLGSNLWLVLENVIINDRKYLDCLEIIKEPTTITQKKAIILDRLRVALDLLENDLM